MPESPRTPAQAGLPDNYAGNTDPVPTRSGFPGFSTFGRYSIGAIINNGWLLF